MPRCLPVLAALLCSVAAVDDVAAQVAASAQPLRFHSSAGAPTAIVGHVTDETGQSIGGVSILAMGSTLAVVRTDDRGRFRLDLSPGAYILRATRDGYVSTYREAVHVRAGEPMTRTITLVSAPTAGGDVVLASMVQPGPVDETVGVEPEAAAPVAPSEMAWRLRHLPRTALRDQSVIDTWRNEAGRARLAPAPPSLGDLNAQVNFLTTSALAASGELPSDDWPRGVAHVVVGAPLGRHGDWSVRAALAGGESAAWTIAGEYASNTTRAHAFKAGVAYSAQTLPDPAIRHSLAAIDNVRRVGGVHVTDTWILGRFEVDSALRIERYDYLVDPALISMELGVRHRLAPRLFVVASASPHKVAPGADQFAPPMSPGVWLPAERTFSALNRSVGLRAQDVDAFDVGVDAVLRRGASAGDDLLLRVRRFSEQSLDQIATLFGLDEASQVGHYYISSPGDVMLDGWLVGVGGPLARHVTAAIDYRTTEADWRRGAARPQLRRTERSAARSGFEQTHDVTATVAAVLPSTSTRVNVAVRVNSAFSRQDANAPEFGTRFALEVRQQLPGSPVGRGDLNLLLSARTLLHDLDVLGGYYNELLTVAPPVRLTCGLQMRF